MAAEPTRDSKRIISRRGVVVGLGVAGAGALLAPAAAHGTEPPAPIGAAGPHASGGAHVNVAPGSTPTPISSPPVAGVTYKFVNMFDFTPENFGNSRAWSLNGGTFTPLGGNGLMWATMDVRPGAQVYDVEWYVYSSQNNTELMTRLWVAGQPQLGTTVSDMLINASPNLRAIQVLTPAASNGPFPHGSMLALGIRTYSDQSVVINGARVGFTLGAPGEVLLPTPVRIYDSRAQSKLRSGHSRSHDLAAQIPAGATGALLNLTVTQTEHSGYLKLNSSGSSSINWYAAGQTLANAANASLPTARTVTVAAAGGGSTHYIVDLLGYLA